MYIDIKRYPPDTKHEFIMEDWDNNPDLILWRAMYTDPKQIEIRVVEKGWKSLGILIDD